MCSNTIYLLIKQVFHNAEVCAVFCNWMGFHRFNRMLFRKVHATYHVMSALKVSPEINQAVTNVCIG